MSMIQGRLSNVAIDPAGGSSYVAVGKVTSAGLSLEADAIDVSNHDSSGNREFIIGFTQGSVSLEINWDDSDGSQEDLIDAWVNKSTVSIRFRLQTNSGDHEFTCATVLVTSLDLDGPNEDQATMSVELQLSGTITRATQ